MPETQAALNAFESVNVPDLVGVVEERLTQAIVQGRLPPGSRVVEAEIARQMAISRAPVREASRRLERQGILVSRPRRGFFVREMSVREIDDLFQVRLSLEMTAVAAACEHADAAGLARLRGLLELMIAEAADAPQHRRIELDLSFHTLICELSGNAYLLRLFSSTQTEMRMIISLIDNVYQDPEMVAATHQPILDALARRDVQAAQACMKVHLDDAWEHVRNLFVSQHGAAGENQGQQENMKVVYSDKHQLHDPQFFIVRGKVRRSNEQPSAARACWRRCGATGTRSSRRPITAPRRARCTRRNTCDSWKPRTRWRELPDASDEVVANVHPFPGQPCTYPEHIVGLAGYHMGDTACPIGAGTWEAAAWSAHCATHAAQLVLDGERAAYALCRPPGHHAYVDRANGFCYLNNAAIAAQHLRAVHARSPSWTWTCITAMAPRVSSTAAPMC